MSAFNLNLELAAPECISPDLDYEQKFLGIIGLPLCALALLAVVALAGYLWNTLIKRSKKGQRQNHVPGLIGAAVLLMLFIYMQETKTALDGELPRGLRRASFAACGPMCPARNPGTTQPLTVAPALFRRRPYLPASPPGRSLQLRANEPA